MIEGRGDRIWFGCERRDGPFESLGESPPDRWCLVDSPARAPSPVSPWLSGFAHHVTCRSLASGGTGFGRERKGRGGCRGLTRTAEGVSAEADLVGALKVVDEGVGTEGGVLARSAAEVGSPGASEGGE